MKYLRKFNEGEKERSIEDWCKYFKLMNYTINEDGTVDVNYRATIDGKNLDRIPIQFGVIDDYFDCQDNKLITLENSPRKVNYYFDCKNNLLTTLKWGPRSHINLLLC